MLGHSHSDHRGAAPSLGAPVFCHPGERPYAEKPTWRENAPYWDMDLLEVKSVHWLYEHWLHDRWDGGAVEIAGTVAEGDDVCGFEVKDLPGHSPGLIGLWRASDRVAIVSDTVYFADSARLKGLDHPNVPHRAFNWDTGSPPARSASSPPSTPHWCARGTRSRTQRRTCASSSSARRTWSWAPWASRAR